MFAFILTVSILALSTASVASASPASSPTFSSSTLDGEAVFRESAHRDSGYGDFKADIVMEITSKSGKTVKRHMLLANLERRGDGAQTRLLFENPPDVKGTVLLSHGHPKAPDEQWIYLPAFKRVKKISGATRASPFMASDFSYEDILSMNPRVEKYTYAKLPSAAWEGLPCFVIDRKPIETGTGYSRQTVWMDTAHYLIRKIEFFGTDGSPSKTLTLHDYRLEKDRHWRAREMRMKNLKTGGETVLRGSEYKLGNGFDASTFDPAALNK
jgi:outer membrane lipoprotein-sorting protein